MKTLFVEKRSELTGKLRSYIANSYTCYRVRISCNCKTVKQQEKNVKSNERNGIIVLKDNTLIHTVIRCKNCLKRNIAVCEAIC